MNKSKHILAAFFAVFFALPLSAVAVIDTDAAVVKVRLNCTEGGIPLDNCFANIALVNSWVIETRQPKPSSAAPLLVEIGPGDFSFPNGPTPLTAGYITYRGAGQNHTVISTLTLLTNQPLEFENLTVRTTPGFGYAAFALNGDTTWHNVFFDGNWLETGATQQEHRWFASRIRGTYKASKDDSWFYGSELSGVPIISGSTYNIITLRAEQNGEIHVYGGNINANKTTGTETVDSFGHTAVFSGNGGKIHIHGTGIDVASNAAGEITALWADGGSIHANGTAYNLSASDPGGVIWRVYEENGGSISAPYHWGVIQNGVPNIRSKNGADIAIESKPSGVVTQYIYRGACNVGSGGPWYNVFANKCRGL